VVSDRIGAMDGPDDEALIALDEGIKNLNSGDGYESDECSTVKSTTSRLSGSTQLHYPTDEELSSICDSTKERSLRQALSDERTFQRFLAFAKRRGCANNLKFWFACERFSKLGVSRGAANPHARDSAKAIYHSFLKNSAQNKVSLKESTVNHIRRSLSDHLVSVNSQLFAAAQQEVYDLMVENEYKQFIMSENYSECSSQFTTSDMLPPESYYSGSSSSLMGYSIPRVPNSSRGASAVHSDIESTSIASYPE